MPLLFWELLVRKTKKIDVGAHKKGNRCSKTKKERKTTVNPSCSSALSFW